MKKSTLTLTLLSALMCSAAFAGGGYILTPAAGGTKETETRAYAGLNWHLGGGATPALVLGVFSARVKPNGDTAGGDLAFHINLADGVKPGSYLNGQNDFQAEAGFGYDFLKNAPLLGLGFNAQHVSLGVDAYANPGFVPYVTLHSMGKFDKPSSSQCVYTNIGFGTYSDPNCTILQP